MARIFNTEEQAALADWADTVLIQAVARTKQFVPHGAPIGTVECNAVMMMASALALAVERRGLGYSPSIQGLGGAVGEVISQRAPSEMQVLWDLFQRSMATRAQDYWRESTPRGRA